MSLLTWGLIIVVGGTAGLLLLLQRFDDTNHWRL